MYLVDYIFDSQILNEKKADIYDISSLFPTF